MKFEKLDLAPEIVRNLQDNGYFRTTDIQFKTIPAVLNGEDVLAIAQTGTGKTAAFAIPIIQILHSRKSSHRNVGIQCLILVPTRELAQQIGQVVAKLSRNTKATSFAVYGGIEQDPQIAQLAGGVDILIATPGRMFDLIHQGHIDPREVNILVLDEADQMLDLGFIEDIESIKRKIQRNHQTLFFSATINPKIKKLAYSQIRSNALRIQVSPEKMVSKNINHSVTRVEMDQKRNLLQNFIVENPEAKTIVFVRTQVRAERVNESLRKNKFTVQSLHGGMDQSERESNLEAFRGGAAGVLIATDVSARGIDLPGITHVINFDVPDNPENYVHRIGRTGRGFAKGSAITFCSSEELGKLSAVEEFLQTKIPQFKVEKALLETARTADIESLDIAEMLAAEEALYEKPKRKKRK